jgi:hypothetical protein
MSPSSLTTINTAAALAANAGVQLKLSFYSAGGVSFLEISLTDPTPAAFG